MNVFRTFINLSIAFFLFSAASVLFTGCAQIGAPTGGPRDTLAPKLVSAFPKEFTTGFSEHKITLNFNEYVDVKDIPANVIVSPYPAVAPVIDYKLKTVTVKLKDTLHENTTYAIDFGNSIRDNNEGNPFRNYTYVFSTGTKIDSFTLTGNVTVSETGKPDSTLIVMLYRYADDSAVQKRKPDYIARLDSGGHFLFRYLPASYFKIFALKDGDGSKTYNSPTEMFAFADKEVLVNSETQSIKLFAYLAEKESDRKKPVSSTPSSKLADKRLRYTTLVSSASQDLLSDLEIQFSAKIVKWDSSKIMLTDTAGKTIMGIALCMDTTNKNIVIKNKWPEDTYYKLILDKEAVTDSLGRHLTKTDTLSFKTKKNSEYGDILLRFNNYNPSVHAVVQFVNAENVIIRSVPITAPQWRDKLFPPGEYELRILYDENNNGHWDPGNYHEKKQPEKAVVVDKRLNIRASWENERDVPL